MTFNFSFFCFPINDATQDYVLYRISFRLSHVDVCNKCVCLMNDKTSELYDRRWRTNAFKLVQYRIVFVVISVMSYHQPKSSQISSSL